MTWFNACGIDGHENQASNNNMDTSTGKSAYCSLCQEQGRKVKLRLFQINSKESLMLCSTKTCTYPMGLKPSKDLIVERSWSAAVLGQKRKLPTTQQGLEKQKLAQTTSASAKKPRLMSNKETVGSIQPPANNLHSGYPPKAQNVLPAHPNPGVKVPTVVPIITQSQMNGISQSICDRKTDSNVKNNVIQCNQQSTVVTSTCKSQSVRLCTISQNAITNGQAGGEIYFMQWRNRDKLCWLDAIMCMFVQSYWLQQYFKQENITDSALIRLMRCYQEANNLVHLDPASSQSSHFLANNQNPDGIGQTDKQLAKICLEKAETIMLRGQDSMWRHLQPKLRCIQGEENSAVCGLMAVLSTESVEVQQLCSLTYRLQAKCRICGNLRENILEKRVVLFPRVPDDFKMSKPEFHGKCDKCQAMKQTVAMDIQRYPRVLFSHFVDGVPGTVKHISTLDFTSPCGGRYRVKAVVQYRRNPDHFVAWIRDIQMPAETCPLQ